MYFRFDLLLLLPITLLLRLMLILLPMALLLYLLLLPMDAPSAVPLLLATWLPCPPAA